MRRTYYCVKAEAWRYKYQIPGIHNKCTDCKHRFYCATTVTDEHNEMMIAWSGGSSSSCVTNRYGRTYVNELIEIERRYKIRLPFGVSGEG